MLPFDRKSVRTWSMLGACGAFGLSAYDLAEHDKDFAVVTADLCFFSGLERYRAAFPEQLYNVGIAEQNMIGVAAGMANEGMNVFATTYASFACTRALDQVKVNMGYMQQPVKLIGLTSGYSVGILGATHIAIEDLAIMRAIPNITVLSPADCGETVKCIYAAAALDRPVYIRFTGTQRVPIVYKEDYEFQIGKDIILREGSDIAFFATGPLVYECLKAADKLDEQGVSCAVIDVHTIKPLDTETIERYLQAGLIVTAEDHNVIGGLGSAVAETISQFDHAPRLLKIGVQDEYIHAADYETMMNRSGLKCDQIVEKVLSSWR